MEDSTLHFIQQFPMNTFLSGYVYFLFTTNFNEFYSHVSKFTYIFSKFTVNILYGNEYNIISNLYLAILHTQFLIQILHKKAATHGVV